MKKGCVGLEVGVVEDTEGYVMEGREEGGCAK